MEINHPPVKTTDLRKIKKTSKNILIFADSMIKALRMGKLYKLLYKLQVVQERKVHLKSFAEQNNLTIMQLQF